MRIQSTTRFNGIEHITIEPDSNGFDLVLIPHLSPTPLGIHLQSKKHTLPKLRSGLLRTLRAPPDLRRTDAR